MLRRQSKSDDGPREPSREQGGEGLKVEDRPAFGMLLRQYRVAAGLAQETLAERASISVQAISALERGLRKVPQRHTLRAILAALALDEPGRRELEAAAMRVAVPRSRDKSLPNPAAAARAPRAMPAPLTAFFGRTSELEETAHLLHDTRLLTIAGPGGMGKTRLALALAGRLAERFADGVYFVELQPVADAALVPSAILEALSLPEEPNRSIETTLVEHLRDRTALIVLDNCEHVREAAARIVERLLRAGPNLRIVTTARVVLSIPGEMTYRLLPLREADSAALFAERARAANATYEETSLDAAAVAGIVRKLDGIPLAVELAAARTRVMSLETLALRLDDVLRAGSTANGRTQPTLRAALDWSYDYLSAEERMLFERFAVFTGSWTLEAAEGVCGGNGLDETRVLDLLTRLVDTSLLQMERHTGHTRFRYLDTVRAYASEKFAASPARDAVHEAHVCWYVRYTEALESALYDAGQLRALDEIGSEIDDIRSALDRALVLDPSAENALRLTSALWRYWLIRNNFQEGRAALNAVLARSAPAFPALRGRSLVGLGSMQLQSREFAAAWNSAHRANELFREAGDERGIVHALSVSTIAAVFFPDARDVEREYAELGERAANATDLWVAALPLFTGAFRALRDAHARDANAHLERAREIVVELGAPYDIAAIACHLGYTRIQTGDEAGAARAFFESIHYSAALLSRDVVGHCAEGLACVAVSSDRAADAAGLFGTAQAIRDASGGRFWSHWRELHERSKSAARETLGGQRFDELAQAGYDLGRRDPFVPLQHFESAYAR